jgi:hypothetical protein
MADERDGKVAGVAGDLEAAIPDADADDLVAEAVRQREEQRSGRSMRRQLPYFAGCVIAGLLLIAGGDLLGHAVAVVALIVGVITIAVSGLLLLRALDLSPVTQWGEPVGEPCPACGGRGLREGRVAIPRASGVVALCTAECGYADVRPGVH